MTDTAAPARQRRRIARTRPEATSVSVDFFGDDNTTVTATETLDVTSLSTAMLHLLAAYGAGQAAQQGYADADDARAATQATFAKITGGEWKPGRPAGERTAPDIVLALVAATNQPLDYVWGRWENELSKEQKAQMRAHPDVQAALAKILAEKAKDKAKTAKKADASPLTI